MKKALNISHVLMILLGSAFATTATAKPIEVFGITADMTTSERKQVMLEKGFQCKAIFNGDEFFCSKEKSPEVVPIQLHTDYVQIFHGRTRIKCGAYSDCKFSAAETSEWLVRSGKVAGMKPEMDHNGDISKFITVGPEGNRLTVDSGYGFQHVELERFRLGNNALAL